MTISSDSAIREALRLRDTDDELLNALRTINNADPERLSRVIVDNSDALLNCVAALRCFELPRPQSTDWQQMRKIIDQWQEENGAFTPEERAAARNALGR